MSWTIVFHPLVATEDLPALDHAARAMILKAIRKKLAADPEQYGDPLRGGLAGFRKLRIGAYRVVYAVKRQIVRVYVLKVGIRRDLQIYEEFARRLPKL